MTGRSSFGFTEACKLVLSQLEPPIQRRFPAVQQIFCVCTVMGNCPHQPLFRAKTSVFQGRREYEIACYKGNCQFFSNLHLPVVDWLKKWIMD